ncbi:glycerophosphodiester phosphodiesterase family protein [Pseudohoeflea coraliihabitans]|uniref:Glycerophosphodiester phosphodiesterase family protein n=1 Tax=Pseudohoeflea coraliihabitans TaxID=2860393 RepID=A0ABS6WS91_9HYPH|nr:glycerophosphodiester phosphodiesterase family protein [Pseudohoeflea sp. DP4N28-3]MBW3097950.1 glycerophosphodiester phosphodiesterase family protein [Pseudohoeflea sp. DP4N28-3]
MTLQNLHDFHRDPHWCCAIVAHRGVWRDSSENSVASVEAAIASDLQFVEIDVRRSRDGKLICFHDETLDRMTAMTGPVDLHDWRTLSSTALKYADGGPAAELSPHTIPALEHILEAARERIYIDLDIKHEYLLDDTVAAIQALDMGRQIILKIEIHRSEDFDRCERMARDTGFIFKPVVMVTAGNLDWMLSELERRAFPVVEALFETWEQIEAVVPRMRKHGTDVFLNSLDGIAGDVLKDRDAMMDPQKVWRRAIELGVRLIQTDRPRTLYASLQNNWRRD